MKESEKKSSIAGLSLREMKDKYVGVEGSESRRLYQHQLNMELLGRMIRATRKFRKLTQLELGEKVGVGKAQISKWETSANNATVDTIVKLFSALGAEIGFSVQVGDSGIELLENSQK
ncbi:MAG: helix-turn-helix transcriptional regulator [Bacteroidetes bacterium]|nr:helix-turn-helix transcriptional regulator [Bacteroidota bacterium]